MERIRLYNNDCLNAFKLIEDKTIDLILIDPPYNISKADWDKWKTTEEYVKFMGKIFKECQRVLKDNGSFYFFHNDFLQIVELQNYINKNTNFIFKSLITWNKKHFKRFAWLNRRPEKCKDRNWFPNVEYCLYYTFQDETGLTKIKTDLNNFEILREYFKEIQELLNLNKKQIMEQIGQKADHCFRWGSSQWDLPTEETYNELINKFRIDKFKCFKKYEDLRQEYEKLRQEYEKQRYVFNLNEVQENISCVWENNDKNSGKLHPCEKPLDILEKIIKTSSNKEDIVLDCFMGSGSTGVTCVNTGRRFVGIEIDNNYFNIAKERIEKASNISFF